MQFKRLVSRQFIFVVHRGDDRRKVFQVMFLRDGSVVVNFPYFRDSTGLLSQPTMPPGKPIFEKFTIGKNDGSKCTSHRVKYTHHLDGEAHFSQDGKIRTEVRRVAVPLRQADGHLFTLRVQGLDRFSPLMEKIPEKTRRRYTIEFKAPDSFSGSLQFTGWVYRVSDIIGRMPVPPPIMGPSLFIADAQHGKRQAVALGNLREPEDDTVLVVSVNQTGRLFTNAESGLIFMGGFDPPALVNDYSKPSSFLILRCPIEDIALATSEIGTVDLC